MVAEDRGRASGSFAEGYVLSWDEALLVYYTSTEKLCCLSWGSSYFASTFTFIGNLLIMFRHVSERVVLPASRKIRGRARRKAILGARNIGQPSNTNKELWCILLGC